jgi:hypothetical protein
MIKLSTLRYSKIAYGSASQVVLRKMDHIHHREVRFGFGTFAVYKTQNTKCGTTNTNENEGRKHNEEY